MHFVGWPARRAGRLDKCVSCYFRPSSGQNVHILATPAYARRDGSLYTISFFCCDTKNNPPAVVDGRVGYSGQRVLGWPSHHRRTEVAARYSTTPKYRGLCHKIRVATSRPREGF